MITYMKVSYASPRRIPKSGDLKYTKSRDQWYVRKQSHCRDGYLVHHNGTPMWEWLKIDKDQAVKLVEEGRFVVGAKKR